MVVNDMLAQIRNSFKDNHFKVLGFTAVMGKAVMCAIIIAASKLKVTDVTGFNPLSEDCGDCDMEESQKLEDKIANMKDEHINGVDRMFPFGPTYTSNGVTVPTFITCSKNESITSQLLTNMLKKMEDLMLFDRNDGVNPCILCDAHGTRFKEPFLEYIHESDTPWGCFIGVPYGTSLRQSGESKEQNDAFKIQSKKSKSETVRANIKQA
jgi:hypothetical protein